MNCYARVEKPTCRLGRTTGRRADTGARLRLVVGRPREMDAEVAGADHVTISVSGANGGRTVDSAIWRRGMQLVGVTGGTTMRHLFRRQSYSEHSARRCELFVGLARG